MARLLGWRRGGELMAESFRAAHVRFLPGDEDVDALVGQFDRGPSSAALTTPTKCR